MKASLVLLLALSCSAGAYAEALQIQPSRYNLRLRQSNLQDALSLHWNPTFVPEGTALRRRHGETNENGRRDRSWVTVGGYFSAMMGGLLFLPVGAVAGASFWDICTESQAEDDDGMCVFGALVGAFLALFPSYCVGTALGASLYGWLTDAHGAVVYCFLYAAAAMSLFAPVFIVAPFIWVALPLFFFGTPVLANVGYNSQRKSTW